MTDWETLMSPKAIVCHRQVHGEAGSVTVYSVCLADGFLVDCGSDSHAWQRAKELTLAINAADPERFNFGRTTR